MKKTVLIILITLFSFVLFAQSVAEVSSEPAATTQIFVDDLGREVELPANITRIAPSGSNAQVIVFQIAPEKLVGLATKLSGDELAVYPSYTHDLPAFGTLYGKKANLNKETLILANPEVIIDVGDIKGSGSIVLICGRGYALPVTGDFQGICLVSRIDDLDYNVAAVLGQGGNDIEVLGISLIIKAITGEMVIP